MTECKDCRGTGKMTVIFSSHTPNGSTEPEALEMDCVRCDGGKIAPKTFLEDTIEWCRCGEDSTFGSYPEDGECSCGIYKHHVHCGICDKVSQLG